MRMPRPSLTVDEIDRIVAQRDALLAALRDIIDVLPPRIRNDTTYSVAYQERCDAILDRARAAIARAEGKL